MQPEKLASLSAVIEHDLLAISKLDKQLEELLADLRSPNPAFTTQAATAYILHNFYNALENSFVQISRTFENHVVTQRIARQNVPKNSLGQAGRTSGNPQKEFE